jgi:hypothetical protein
MRVQVVKVVVGRGDAQDHHFLGRKALNFQHAHLILRDRYYSADSLVEYQTASLGQDLSRDRWILKNF